MGKRAKKVIVACKVMLEGPVSVAHRDSLAQRAHLAQGSQAAVQLGKS